MILSAPLSGARPLAEALFTAGWHTGGLCLPDRRDPSRLSFENEIIVQANQSLLEQTAGPRPEWGPPRNNWALMHNVAAVGPVNRAWSDRVMMVVASPGVVVKDAQLAFTIHKWLPLWHPPILSSPPAFEVVVLFRYPLDFVAAMLEGCDKWWPELPKDPDYFLQLWVKYYEAIIAADQGQFHYFNSPDHFIGLPGIIKFNRTIGSDLKPLPTGTIRHLSRRDNKGLPKDIWKLYDRLYWKTMKLEIPA